MSSDPRWGTPPPPQDGPGGSTLTCPKCSGSMRTYDRNGVHIEQCTTCRGIFLDFGELESLTRLEAQVAQYAAPPPQPGYQQGPPPQQYGPGWGSHGHQKYRKGGFGRLFFSS